MLTGYYSYHKALAQVSHAHPAMKAEARPMGMSPTNSPRIGDELGVDPKTILATSHGRRSIDTLKLYDPSRANWDCMSEPAAAAAKL